MENTESTLRRIKRSDELTIRVINLRNIASIK